MQLQEAGVQLAKIDHEIEELMEEAIIQPVKTNKVLTDLESEHCWSMRVAI